MNKAKDFFNLLGLDVVVRFIKKYPTKIIQITVFVLLIFAFTFNHYRFTKPCVEWKKGTSPFADVFVNSPKEVNICAKYGLLPNGITTKNVHTRRIPADFIFLFVGVGIIYFTKDIKSKNS